MKFITRGYNTISLKPSHGTLIKTSTNDKLKDEIAYFRDINDIHDPYLKLLFPRLIAYEIDSELYKLEMEFYPFRNLGNYITETENLGEEFWNNIFNMLFAVIERMKITTNFLLEDEINKHCHSMFIEKTLREYKNLKDNFPFFASLSKFNTIELNNIEYKNFELIWEKVLNRIDIMISEEDTFNIVHGDLCFSNILLGENNNIDTKTLKLVDPRGSFGTKGIYGTSLYDFAKLSHSINGGYEFFIYDQFKVENSSTQPNKFSLEIYSGINKKICEKLFLEHLADNPKYLQKIKLIEGLIFIGMCARHYDNFDRQQAMYLTGIKILNEVINENLC
tara:strand:- start:2604 stop:3608 length:1005 start_codon:yes stop_codon:yes gene_type:complete